MLLAAVAFAGAVGAVLRFLVDRAVQTRSESDFPVGTLVVNVSGAAVLGFLTGAGIHHHLADGWVTILGTGLIGSYTTFSTFAYDVRRLFTEDAPTGALVNVGVSVLAGLGAAAAGLALGATV
jgi:CrcB protein